MYTIYNEPTAEKKIRPGNGVTKNTIIERVGNTPLIELPTLSKSVQPVKIQIKAEWFNPGGSVKDRAALNMILDGEKSGKLTLEKIILDATSGNTGIAYAMFGAALGYKVKLTMPTNAGQVFKHTIQAYGAEIVYSNPQHGSDGAIREAIRLFEEAPEQYFYPDQYNNPANWLAHYEGTGLEIIQQANDEVTHFIAGLGTSGTFMGTGRRLKQFYSDIKLISVQPDSPFHGLEGLKHMETAIVPGIYEPELANQNIKISTEDAQKMVKHLARTEGVLVGISAGAALVAAIQVGRNIARGNIVVIIPDNANKYFDQRFWRVNNHGY